MGIGATDNNTQNTWLRNQLNKIAQLGGPRVREWVSEQEKSWDNLKSRFTGVAPSADIGSAASAQTHLADPLLQMNAGIYTNTGSSALQSLIRQDVAGAMQGGYGLTPDQAELLASSGFKPGTPEYKQQEFQLKIANYKNLAELVSNIGKMLTDLGNRLVGNVRS